MRKFLVVLAIAASPFLAVEAADAQARSGQTGDNPDNQPNVTVRAPERMVCRSVTRTATRMRASRVCRPVSQWTAAAAGAPSQDEVLDDAANTLDGLRADDISTGCEGGLPPAPGPRPRK